MPKPYVDAAKVSQFSIMAKIKIWPHEEICPNGADIESLPDETICEAALRNNIKIEHNYSDKDGNYIFSVFTENTDCSEEEITHE